MKKSRNDLFEEIKIKMVMNVHGISRNKAMELIAKRSVPGVSNGKDGGICADKANRRRSYIDDDVMSAEEFFGG